MNIEQQNAPETRNRSLRSFRRVFPNRHAILPVIHVESLDQALRNAGIARKEGCDGVFFINHGMAHGRLLEILSASRRALQDWWIGVNCLDLHAVKVFHEMTAEVGGVWVDNAMIDERVTAQQQAESIKSARLESGWEGLYFGGVAFKYQRHVADLARAAHHAMRYMDVVTTSGTGTGQAAACEKIVALRQAMGGHPLAIASGITPDNVSAYLDAADCFLVATGISSSFTDFDRGRVRALVQAVRSVDRNHELGREGENLANGSPQVRSVCFVCEWNEGRSVHLALSTRMQLKAAGSRITVTSAGLSQGGHINALRREFLLNTGVPSAEITGHAATVLDTEHVSCDLILVAERQMQQRILNERPDLRGKVMTVKGFALGYAPDNEALSESESRIEDAGGHSSAEKLALYTELEELAACSAHRLLLIEGTYAEATSNETG